MQDVAPDPDIARDAIEYCYQQGWSDGLPLVPASRALVERFLEQTERDPKEEIGHIDIVDRTCTVELAAVNAAMAGCLPEYFPLVLAAWDSLLREPISTQGAWQSTSGPAPIIIVNGPIRNELGLNSGGGIFGPGFRPNATIPRAIGLMVRNAFGLHPHIVDQSTQGVPGRWTICFGENEEESPWEPLSVEMGLPEGTNAVSTMLARTCEFIDNRVTQDPEELLWDFAQSIARTGALLGRGTTTCGIVFGLEHARTLGDAGFSKSDVKKWFVDNCTCTEADLAHAGKSGGRRAAPNNAPGDLDARLNLIPSERHIPIIVGGAGNAAMSMIIRIFSTWSNTALPVASPRAQPALS